LQPKFEAAGEGSLFTVCHTPPYFCAQYVLIRSLSQMATLLKQLGVGATEDLVPLIYAGLVDPLLAVRAQVNDLQFIFYS
jgi:hypothetical protein